MHAAPLLIVRCPNLSGVLAVLVTILATSPAQALVYTVGVGAGCTHSTLQAAINSAEASAGMDTIRVTRSQTYTAQQNNINTAQDLDIVGGYATCAQTTADVSPTVLSGAGGQARSVITIINSAGTVKLRRLSISDGDQAGDDHGGGVYFQGNGILDIADVSISDNIAGYGGGIYALGTGTAAELIIGEDVAIIGNTARYNGGGIYSNEIETTIASDNTTILFNQATGVVVGSNISGGYGGGVHIRACDFTSIVYLGSPGAGGLAVVSENSARYGGGVAIEGADGCDNNKSAELRMFSTNADRLTTLRGNNATVAGGGVYAHPNSNFLGSIFDITKADAYFWNANIEDNTSPQGSALYLGSDDDVSSTSDAFFNVGTAPPAAIPCTPGRTCGRISGNGSAGSGRVIAGEEFNTLELRSMILDGNHGSELIRLDLAGIHDSLIGGNETTARLLEARYLTIYDSTIAGNTIGGVHTLSIGEFLDSKFISSIIWQPGKLTLNNNGGEFTATDVISSDTTTLLTPTSERLLNANPRFVDPANGDYSLKAASPAVEYAEPVDGADFDLIGNRRDIELTAIANRYGRRDLGAYERQSVQPLVQNSDFNANLNTWDVVTAGGTTWDSTQNVSGPTGSGSLRINLATTATSVSARSQCIHLPAPGDYSLNGWGKSTGTPPLSSGDQVKLFWEFRSNGSETCTGTVARNGNLLLANTRTWRRPQNAAHIVVPAAEWTSNSSLLVYLLVEESGGAGIAPEAPNGSSLDGWFDGITLDLPTDRIFANGFE